MMKKIISIFILLFTVSLVNAYDLEKTVTFNETQLPQSGTFNFPFELLAGETLYFEVKTNHSALDFDYVEQYELSGTNSYEFSLNYEVDRTFITEDKTYMAELLVNNSLNSNLYSVGLFFEIINQNSSVFEITSSTSLSVIDGIYHKNVSLFDFPGNGTIDFNIVGNPDEQYTFSQCEENRFIRCQENSTFNLDSNGEYLLKVPYSLPFTPLGTYNDTFHLRSVSRNYTLDVVFNVIQPNVFLKPLDLDPRCYEEEDSLTIKERLDCEIAIAEWQLNKFVELNNYYSRINTENICEQFVKTEYIVGDSISTEVLDRNQKLLQDNADLRVENTRISEELSSCRILRENDKTTFNRTLTQKDNEIRQTVIESEKTNIQIKNNEKTRRDTEKQDLIDKWKFLAVCGMICCGVLAGYKFYRENNFQDVKGINYWIVLIVGLIFLFGWFGLWVWS
jgi:hypothetical protein